jgi:hypothetical protein
LPLRYIKLSSFDHFDSADSDQKISLNDKHDGSFKGSLVHSTQTMLLPRQVMLTHIVPAIAKIY